MNQFDPSAGSFSAEVNEDYSGCPAGLLVAEPFEAENYSYRNVASCPDCGSGMVRLGTCFSCPACGFGSCGA